MKTALFALALSISLPVFAQQHQHQAAAQEVPSTVPPHHTASPYAGQQTRAIKALSEQQTADLRAGKGMALALPAELNGYPGPAHVLELAQLLKLSDEQTRNTQTLMQQMQAETRALGEAVIAGESALDRLFRDKSASLASVQDATDNAARAQGRLRAAHLKYHLGMLEILTPAQIDLYGRLRGYQ